MGGVLQRGVRPALAGEIDPARNNDAVGDCGIGRITVTSAATDPEPFGIGGDIRAGGNIGAIFSTGPIASRSSLASAVTIQAGGSIEQIRTIQQDSTGIVLNRDAKMEVQSGTKFKAYGSVAALAALTGDPTKDGPVALIDVGGTLEGRVAPTEFVSIVPQTAALRGRCIWRNAR